MTAGPPISTSFGRYQEEAVLFNRIMPCEPFCAIFGWLRAATQNHLAPMCTSQKTTDSYALTNYEYTRVSRWHPQISIHLGGTIEAYCHCAASCYSAMASNGCAASYRRLSAHLSDGFSAAVLPAAALATAGCLIHGNINATYTRSSLCHVLWLPPNFEFNGRRHCCTNASYPRLPQIFRGCKEQLRLRQVSLTHIKPF